MIPTIIISAVLAAVVGLIIYRMICNAKSKQGGCASCGYADTCAASRILPRKSDCGCPEQKKTDWQVRTPIFGRKTEGPRHLASHDQEEPLSRPERMECSLTPTDRVGFRQFGSFSLELQPKQRHFGVYIAHFCTLAIVFTS